MTLLKSKAQSTVEYLILTILVVTMMIIFAKNKYYTNIKNGLDTAFQGAVGTMIK